MQKSRTKALGSSSSTLRVPPIPLLPLYLDTNWSDNCISDLLIALGVAASAMIERMLGLTSTSYSRSCDLGHPRHGHAQSIPFPRSSRSQARAQAAGGSTRGKTGTSARRNASQSVDGQEPQSPSKQKYFNVTGCATIPETHEILGNQFSDRSGQSQSRNASLCLHQVSVPAWTRVSTTDVSARGRLRFCDLSDVDGR